MLSARIIPALLDDRLSMWAGGVFDVNYLPECDEHRHSIVKEYQDYVKKKYCACSSQKTYNSMCVKCDTKSPPYGEIFIQLLDIAQHRDFVMYIAEQLWLSTSENLRFSNRYQVNMYGLYERYAGSDKLDQMEHLRWNAERSIIGYKQSKLKHGDYQIHNLIMRYNELPDKETGKDKDVVRNMIVIKKVFNETTKAIPTVMYLKYTSKDQTNSLKCRDTLKNYSDSLERYGIKRILMYSNKRFDRLKTSVPICLVVFLNQELINDKTACNNIIKAKQMEIELLFVVESSELQLPSAIDKIVKMSPCVNIWHIKDNEIQIVDVVTRKIVDVYTKCAYQR